MDKVKGRPCLPSRGEPRIHSKPIYAGTRIGRSGEGGDSVVGWGEGEEEEEEEHEEEKRRRKGSFVVGAVKVSSSRPTSLPSSIILRDRDRIDSRSNHRCTSRTSRILCSFEIRKGGGGGIKVPSLPFSLLFSFHFFSPSLPTSLLFRSKIVHRFLCLSVCLSVSRPLFPRC